jgi:hypothetical protein
MSGTIYSTVSRNNKNLAETLAKAGVSVFPSDHETKRPIIRWKLGGSTNLETIAAFWTRWPLAVPTIHFEKSGLIALDADRHPGGEDGVQRLRDLFLAYGFRRNDAPMIGTPGGGVHVWFRNPQGLRSKLLAPGVEIKGLGSCMTAPGSMKPDGSLYRPLNDHPFLPIADLPELPAWIVQKAYPPPPKPKPTKPVRHADRYVEVVLNNELGRVMSAVNGQRNYELFRAALKIGTCLVVPGRCSFAVAEDRLVQTAMAAGIATGTDLRQALQTIRSGLHTAEKNAL